MHISQHGNKTDLSRASIRGMTLIELTIGMAVLGVCSILTMGPVVSTFDVLVSVSDIRGTYEDGKSALKRIATELKEAETATLVGQTGIRIVKAHSASDGYEQVYFYKDGSVLYRKGEPNGTAKVLAQNVSGFAVAQNEVAPNVYTIRMTMQAADESQYQLRMDVYPMNLTGVSGKNFYNTSTSSGDWAFVISSY